jgi:hypothetical protein
MKTTTDYVTPTLLSLSGLCAAVAISPLGALIGLGMAAAIVAVAWLLS